MQTIATNKKAVNQFATQEFNHWAWRQGLTSEEQYLIERFLDRRGTTLEAGTGGGRILLELQKRDFEALVGFDAVPGFIDLARQKDPSGRISFDVQDATTLTY